MFSLLGLKNHTKPIPQETSLKPKIKSQHHKSLQLYTFKMKTLNLAKPNVKRTSNEPICTLHTAL